MRTIFYIVTNQIQMVTTFITNAPAALVFFFGWLALAWKVSGTLLYLTKWDLAIRLEFEVDVTREQT